MEPTAVDSIRIQYKDHMKIKNEQLEALQLQLKFENHHKNSECQREWEEVFENSRL